MTLKKFILLPVLLLMACQTGQVDPRAWTGRWTGPEGTYLDIIQKPAVDTAPAAYTIAIRDLDKEYRYTGYIRGDKIVFSRDGVPASIHQGNGPDTGMKWLMDKKNCLIIKTGEGYCRN